MIFRFLSTLVILASTAEQELLIESFDARNLPPALKLENAAAKTIAHAHGRALQLRLGKGAETGSAVISGPDGGWDLSAFAGIAVDVTNPGKEAAAVWVSAKSVKPRQPRGQKTGGVKICAPVAPGKTETVRLFFANNGAGPYWGMRGIPLYGPVSTFGDRMAGEPIDPAHVSLFGITLRGPDRRQTLVIDGVRAFTQDSPLAQLVPHPFIDAFGQFIHAAWPGKLTSEEELRSRRDSERATLAAAPELPGRDRFGGWANGPQLAGTGWFRTEKLDGTWWLVTPEGRLFFSIGMNCLYPGDSTFIDGRDGWFAELPEAGPPADPLLAGFYGTRNGVHSMGGPIDGRGRTFDFYGANLVRKYGDPASSRGERASARADWHEQWRDVSYARLRAWGFNTIGNWAREDVLANSPMPFTVNLGNSGVPAVEGATGFWGNMMDVYDPAFEKSAEEVGKSAAQYASNPLVVGFFVDNELSWENVGAGALASPSSQPARIALIEMLKSHYGNIDGLNGGWGTDAPDWDSLRAPASINRACKQDLDAFVYAFAHRYFLTIKEALKQNAPNHLYLGCRFSRMVPPAIAACDDDVDVVSFNLYRDAIRCDPRSGGDWCGPRALQKPVIIGEFHCGATDRGMFHPGLRGARNQQERADWYRRYVESVAGCPAFVGCHWFQYKDQPTTGRDMDGENFSVGFVSITDTPYPELVETARDVHANIYPFRYDAPSRK